jgi:hypothetical protein
MMDFSLIIVFVSATPRRTHGNCIESVIAADGGDIIKARFSAVHPHSLCAT